MLNFLKKKAITISELIPGAIYSSNIKDKEILLKEVLCVHEKELFILTKSNIEIKEEKNKRKKEKDNIQTSNYRISGQNIKIQNKILEKDEYFDYIFMEIVKQQGIDARFFALPYNTKDKPFLFLLSFTAKDRLINEKEIDYNHNPLNWIKNFTAIENFFTNYTVVFVLVTNKYIQKKRH